MDHFRRFLSTKGAEKAKGDGGSNTSKGDALHRNLLGLSLKPMDDISLLAAALDYLPEQKREVSSGRHTTQTPDHMGNLNRKWIYDDNYKAWYHNIVGSSPSERLAFSPSTRTLHRFIYIEVNQQGTKEWIETALDNPFGSYLQAYQAKELPPPVPEKPHQGASSPTRAEDPTKATGTGKEKEKETPIVRELSPTPDSASQDSAPPVPEKPSRNTPKEIKDNNDVLPQPLHDLPKPTNDISLLAAALNDPQNRRQDDQGGWTTSTPDHTGKPNIEWAFSNLEKCWYHFVTGSSENETLVFRPNEGVLERYQHNQQTDKWTNTDLGDPFKDYLQSYHDILPQPLHGLATPTDNLSLLAAALNDSQNYQVDTSGEKHRGVTWTPDHTGKLSIEWTYNPKYRVWVHNIVGSSSPKQLVFSQLQNELRHIDIKKRTTIAQSNPFGSYLQAYPTERDLPPSSSLQPNRFEPVVWKDIPPNPVDRTKWQKFVDTTKRPFKGGDRPRRAEKRRNQAKDIAEQLITKLNKPDSLPFPVQQEDATFKAFAQRVQNLRNEFQTSYDNSTYNWQEASWRKRHIASRDITEQQTNDQKTRMDAHSRLKIVEIRLGEMNRDLQTLQQVQQYKAKQGDRWSNTDENTLQTAIDHYSNGLNTGIDTTTRQRSHNNDFEEPCYQILRESLTRSDLTSESEFSGIHPQLNRRIREVNRKRGEFDVLRESIKEKIEKESFKTLDAWQQSGIIKRVYSLIQTFVEHSEPALEAEHKASRKTLKDVNAELTKVNDLLDKLDISKNSNRITEEWEKVVQAKKQKAFGGNETQFQRKLKKYVNNAIGAYIVKYDGSFLAGRDERPNAQALRKFDQYRKRYAAKIK